MEWPPKNLPRDFPLTIHPRGYVKKGIGWICGKKSPADALAIYHRKAIAAAQGKPAAPVPTGSVEEVAERWLAVKLADATAGQKSRQTGKHDAGDEISITFDHYAKCRRAAVLFVDHICTAGAGQFAGMQVGAIPYGELTPDVFSDFGSAMRAKNGRGFAARQCRLVMAMFRHADAEDWIDRPIKFGKRFVQMSKLPRPEKKQPPTAEDVRQVLKHLHGKINRLEKSAGKGSQGIEPVTQLIAAIYLAINGGYGARDLAELPKDPSIVDLGDGVIDYRRGKTNQIRRVPLMPEAVEWLRRVWAFRPGDSLVFRTREGNPISREVVGERDGAVTVNNVDSLNQAYSKVLRTLKIKKPGNGFYKIKDLHCTLADECGDDRAARLLTGHAALQRDIRDVYVTVSIERQRKIVEYIRHSILQPDGAQH